MQFVVMQDFLHNQDISKATKKCMTGTAGAPSTLLQKLISAWEDSESPKNWSLRVRLEWRRVHLESNTAGTFSSHSFMPPEEKKTAKVWQPFVCYLKGMSNVSGVSWNQSNPE